MAPQKLDLTTLKKKTEGKELYFPPHILTFVAQVLKKVEETYDGLEKVLKGDKELVELYKEKAKLETDVKEVLSNASNAIERLKVQVSEVDSWRM